MEPNTLYHASLEHRLKTHEKDFLPVLPAPDSLGFQILLAKNREIANRRFTLVLLVHLLVFRQLLRAARENGGEISEDHKHRWLLAQWCYPILDPADTPRARFDQFGKLFHSIEFESAMYIEEIMSEAALEIYSLLPEVIKTDGLFFVIDEANVGTHKLPHAFHDETGLYSSLKEVIRIWRDRLVSLGVPVTFVVAGTEIPKSHFPQSSPEWSSWKWTSNTGSLRTREIQERYVIPYLPPCLVETPSGELLLKRIWNWCRSRHRFTSLVVSLLLQDGFSHPHGVVDRYVQKFTKYLPKDAAHFTEEEGPCNIRLYFNSIGELVRKNVLIQSTAHEVIFHYLVTGEHPPFFGFGRVDLVTSGIGQFVDAEMQSIAVDMPTVLVASAIELSKKFNEHIHTGVLSIHSYEAFKMYLRNRWENGDTYAPASYIALYLAHAFQKGAYLKDIFKLQKDSKWANKNRGQLEHIVIFHRDESGVLCEKELGPSSLLPESPLLGYRARTAADVDAWLNFKRPPAFCICPPECGVDLMFIIKRGKRYLRFLLRTAGLGTDDPSIDLQFEFDKLLSPDLWAKHDALIDALPTPLLSGGELPIIRVVASFLSSQPLPSHANDKSPIALLRTELFQQITEAFQVHGPLARELQLELEI
ncbi:hypothetical protein H0H81_000951 [Sphagnurus paluster]|uniref:Uncharacterized protein n=1 Tax=Sphagnurus paluster TaxID=117069 RepID=A0A9P7FTV1_9AGAR|nr:hypothetical protein H0H81_000951 [Sphagnurus paluster]